jgi:hypothetical protein
MQHNNTFRKAKGEEDRKKAKTTAKPTTYDEQ